MLGAHSKFSSRKTQLLLKDKGTFYVSSRQYNLDLKIDIYNITNDIVFFFSLMEIW